jgi:hypothetical protein
MSAVGERDVDGVELLVAYNLVVGGQDALDAVLAREGPGARRIASGHGRDRHTLDGPGGCDERRGGDAGRAEDADLQHGR